MPISISTSSYTHCNRYERHILKPKPTYEAIVVSIEDNTVASYVCQYILKDNVLDHENAAPQTYKVGDTFVNTSDWVHWGITVNVI